MLSSIIIILLVLLYLKPFLKWLKRKNIFGLGESQFLSGAIDFLKKIHCWIGTLAVILIIIHCVESSHYEENVFLFLIIILAVVVGVLGWLMKFSFVSHRLKTISYHWHAHWWHGLVFLALVLIGHLLLF